MKNTAQAVVLVSDLHNIKPVNMPAQMGEGTIEFHTLLRSFANQGLLEKGESIFLKELAPVCIDARAPVDGPTAMNMRRVVMGLSEL